MSRDRTPLACLAIVALAATLNLGRIIPSSPTPTPTPNGWWDVWCEIAPWLWSCGGIVDPPMPAPAPEPIELGPEAPATCDPATTYGPC